MQMRQRIEFFERSTMINHGNRTMVTRHCKFPPTDETLRPNNPTFFGQKIDMHNISALPLIPIVEFLCWPRACPNMAVSYDNHT